MKRNKIRRLIVKTYFSIKGFLKVRDFKIGEKYIGGSGNRPSIYRGNRTFYESFQITEPTYGVTYFSSCDKKYPFWQIGILKWTINKDIKIEK